MYLLRNFRKCFVASIIQSFLSWLRWTSSWLTFKQAEYWLKIIWTIGVRNAVVVGTVNGLVGFRAKAVFGIIGRLNIWNPNLTRLFKLSTVTTLFSVSIWDPIFDNEAPPWGFPLINGANFCYKLTDNIYNTHNGFMFIYI